VLAAFVVAAWAGVQAVGAEPPRAVVRHATAAVEGDSVAPVAARWRAATRPRTDRLALLGLATVARLTYDYRAADSLYGLVVADSARAGDAAAVYARLGQGLAARIRGAQHEAHTSFERAWADARRAGDSAAATEAGTLLAVTRARTRGPAAADSTFAEAARFLGRDPLLEAQYLCTRAEAFALSARPGADDARRGAALAARAGDGRLRAQCIHVIALNHAREGGIWWSASAFAEAIALRRQLRDWAGLASTLQWRGFMLRGVGWLEDARRDLDEAVRLGRLSGNASATAWSLANLAGIALVLGDAAAGARYTDSAATLFAVQGDRYGEQLIEGMRGGIAATARDWDRAARAYRATVERAEQLSDRTTVVVTRIFLAHLAMRRRDWDAARRELETAREAAAAAGMLGRLAALGYHRGTLNLHAGRLAAAETDLRAGLARVERVPAGDRAQFDWQYYYRMRMAELYARRGDLARAESLAVAGVEAADRWRESLTQRELRLQAYQVAEDQSDPDLGLATIIARLAAAGRIETSFGLAERLRARELLERLARAEALAAADSARERAPTPTSFAGVASPAEIAAAIPDERTALLEFVTGRGGEPTTLFVVTRREHRAYGLPAVDSLEQPVERLNALLESGVDARALATSLGAELLEAALGDLPPSVTGLVIVPDGALHRVPFDALIVRGRYVVETYATGIAPSASVAAHLWQTRRTRSAGPVLALADAELPDVPNLAGLPRLRASRREARRVARFATGSTVRLGPEASEAWLKGASLREYRVLHLATHARAEEATLSGSAIALSPGAGEDGLVGPGDLGRLTLDADLVVLSSCRSGTGVVVRGEGIVGLAAPLLAAGTRAIVITRWAIDDRQTVRLIETFYQAVARGAAVAYALRTAKLEAVAAGGSPATWAAFTVVGDPLTVVPLSEPRSGPGLAWWMGGVATVALLAFWGRRRARTKSRT
jgi:hypothetical protein